MIDQATKRCIGQMVKGVQVVGARDGDVSRLYTSHWVTQVAFEEPIVMASMSPKHDTHPLVVATGRFSVSVLAGDQIEQGQYFSYPGRRFNYVAEEFVEDWDGLPVVPNALAWLRCEVFERKPMEDHDLFFSRVVEARPGRLGEPPLVYSARHGWRIASERAREPGTSIRDRLLERVGGDASATPGDEEEAN